MNICDTKERSNLTFFNLNKVVKDKKDFYTKFVDLLLKGIVKDESFYGMYILQDCTEKTASKDHI